MYRNVIKKQLFLEIQDQSKLKCERVGKIT